MDGIELLQLGDDGRNAIDMPPEEAVIQAREEFSDLIFGVNWPLLKEQARELEGIVAVQEMELEGDGVPVLDGLCTLLALMQAVAQTYGLAEGEPVDDDDLVLIDLAGPRIETLKMEEG